LIEAPFEFLKALRVAIRLRHLVRATGRSSRA